MKPGELYTPKDSKSIGNYNTYLKRIAVSESKDDMFGYIVIELIKYLGHDNWQFINVGSATVQFADPKTHKSINYISGDKIHKEYIKVGEASDSALYDKFKDNPRDEEWFV